MKIKDTEYLYATTRIRSLERQLINRERTERMLEAKSAEDAVKVLAELGYPDIGAASLSAVERAIAQERERAFELMREISPNPKLIDVFSIKYDYHNAKSLLKADAQGQDARRLLINAGRISAFTLETCLRQMELRDLPPVMREAVEAARETLARTGDPQLMDFILDRACFTEMLDTAKESGSAFLIGYVRLLIDVTNLRSTVRAYRQGRSVEFLRNALIDGGNVDPASLVAALSAQGTIKDVFAGSSLEGAAENGALAVAGETDFIRFERLCDDAVTEYLQSARFVAFGDAPVIAYLAAKENEITLIRILMAGKLQELPAEEIRDRLRVTYV